MSTAYEFLKAIFHNKPKKHNVLIWTLNKLDKDKPKKTNNFYTDLHEAAEYAEGIETTGTNVYFCVGTLPKVRSGRGKLEDILGIGSVHLDIDIQTGNKEIHKKENLPPTLEDATNFIYSIGLPPSILVNSGYGLHAYWLLKDFWPFQNEQDRVEAAGLIETWQKMYRWKAGTIGYDVDATQDLTRVLRVPGTANWKVPGMPVFSSIEKFEDIRYTAGELNKYLSTIKADNQIPTKKSSSSKPSLKSFNDIDIVIDPAAQLDLDTYDHLSNIPKFKATWRRDRKDLQDQSSSSYDMALANMAVNAGLDNQTIVNMLIVFRRKYGDEKPRLDYYQRTIAEARKDKQEAKEYLEAATAPAADRKELKEQISKVLGVRIARIDKQLTDPPAFIVYFENGKFKNIGDGKNLTDQKLFRNHVVNGINFYIKTIKPQVWDSVAQKLLDLVDEVEVATEATEIGEVREILENYLEENLQLQVTAKQHRLNAARHQAAVLDGRVAVQALEVWNYAKRRYSYKLTKTALIGVLKRLEAERKIFNVKDDRDKQHSISVFLLHEAWTPANAVRPDDELDSEVIYAGKPVS